MLKVRLSPTYPNTFWNSGIGVTVSQGHEVLVDETNPIINHALKTNILEAVLDTELKIIEDLPGKNTIKEIVSNKNTKEMKETFEKLKEDEHAD